MNICNTLNGINQSSAAIAPRVAAKQLPYASACPIEKFQPPALIPTLPANEPQFNPQPVLDHATTLRPHVLIVVWDDTDPGQMVSLFEKNDYIVVTIDGRTMTTFDDYGAVLHIARKPEVLQRHIGHEKIYKSQDEWVLIARDDIDNIHCLVRLTEKATPDLKYFVRSLWAMCNVS